MLDYKEGRSTFEVKLKMPIIENLSDKEKLDTLIQFAREGKAAARKHIRSGENGSHMEQANSLGIGLGVRLIEGAFESLGISLDKEE